MDKSKSTKNDLQNIHINLNCHVFDNVNIYVIPSAKLELILNLPKPWKIGDVVDMVYNKYTVKRKYLF
jgi:hypothetical protein